MAIRLILLSASVFAPLSVAGQAQTYRDPSAPMEKRVEDLVGRMTLEEKVAQMQNDASAIPRLGVPAYEYWSEALHGVARGGEATMFPQAIAMAATWDTELLHAEGETIGDEARARYNHFQREGATGRYFGLTFWSPNINIFRDPRWGRGQETLGEDPYLTGTLATEFIEGMQGTDPRYLQAIATPKHYAVHSGPEPLRHGFNVNPSPRDLFETYLPAFRKAIVEGKADSLMCSYNAVNGEPACANKTLLDEILRKAWKFSGFVTSDCGAVQDITTGHRFSANNTQGAALAVKAGTDTTCGHEYVDLVASVHAGLISEAEIDTSVKRLFTARMRLGMFEPADRVPFSRIPITENHSIRHQQLSLRAAREAMVLLKNDGVLPVADRKKLAVIGPGAASLIALEGNYKGTPTHPVFPVDGMEAIFGAASIAYALGAPFVDGVAVPVPRTAFSDGSRGGLRVLFFKGTHFKGKPLLARRDQQIDFDWNAVSPAPGVDPNSFSARWTGSITPPAAGEYKFQIDDRHCDPSDDRETYRLQIEGINEFRASASCTDSGQPRKFLTANFSDTRPHKFVFEYTQQSPKFSAGVTLSWQAPLQALLDQAVHVATTSDVIVAFVGLTPWLEGEEMPLHVPGFEGGDRTDIGLPGTQKKLVAALSALHKPLVVVLESGAAIALGEIAQQANAILEAWYPGEFGGRAIAETLKGLSNPAGRLPVTFYASTAQLPKFEDYSMQGRTYRYFTGTPLYGFGHGLSYTRFRYSNLTTSAVVKAGDDQEVSVDVANLGKVRGDEVVQLYLSEQGDSTAPLRSLKGFTRIQLDPGEVKTVTLRLTARDLALVDADGEYRISSGRCRLWIGGGQPDTGSPGMEGGFEIHGQQTLPR